MDWILFTTSSGANLITQQRDDQAMPERIAKYNRDFSVSHRRWFDSLYKDKYECMGEFDLMSLAFRLDLGLYYWGVVEVPFNHGEEALFDPPFSPPSGRFFSALMSTCNRRFAKIARRRRRTGTLGRKHVAHRCLIPGFLLKRSNILQVVPLLTSWFWLELTEGWRSWADPVAGPAKGDSDSEPSDLAARPA